MIMQSLELLSSMNGIFLQIGAANNGTILTSPFFINAVLPFVLIFTIVFAILQKSSILGDGKRQIDAIVALVIGLIVISFANAVGIITSLMPFLAVSVVIIFVFLLIYSMVFQGKDGVELHRGVKIALGVLIAIAVVIAVLVSTGAWDYIAYEWIYGADGPSIMVNIIFLVIVVAAIATVVLGGGGKKD